MNKIPEINIRESGASHWPSEERRDGYFYFDLRDAEGLRYSIEKHVLVNNIGSIEADRDILSDALAFGICTEKLMVCYDDDLGVMYEKINWS